MFAVDASRFKPRSCIGIGSVDFSLLMLSATLGKSLMSGLTSAIRSKLIFLQNILLTLNFFSSNWFSFMVTEIKV